MKLILKYLLILIITCLSTYLAFLQLGKPLIGIDDANIFFVYARNFANGNGFVYHPGGERVEGFSSVLWVMICSLGYITTKNPEILIIIFNLILISFTVYNFVNFVDKIFNSSKFISFEGTIALAFVFASPVFVSWTILSLMETGIWTFLIVNCVIFLLEFIETKKISMLFIFSALIFLSIFARPEGILIGAIMIILAAFGLKIKYNKITPYIYSPVVFLLVSVITLLVFRLIYFGYPFPNTFYAKISTDIFYSLSEGMKYFIKYFLSNNIVFVCLAGIIFYFIALYNKRKSNKDIGKEFPYVIINLLIMTGLIIPVLWGGDIFIDFRFYQPFLPLMFIPFIFFVKKITGKFNESINITKYGFILIFVFFSLYFYTGAQIKYHQKASISSQQYKIAEENREFGNKLNEYFKNTKLPNIGTIPAGGLAYSYNGIIIDLLGLNNIEMAHSNDEHKGLKNHASFNKDVFYKQSPDFILAGFDTDTSILNSFIDFNNNYDLNKVVLKGILNDETFKEKYQPALTGNGKVVLFAFYRKDYLQTLKNEGFWVKTR